MNLKKTIFLSSLSALAGILFLAYELEWIIIRSPLASPYSHNSAHGASKQKITLWYWHQQSWKQEVKELLIADDPEKKATTILANWLTLMHEEKVLPHKVGLQAALLSPTKTHLYISCDQNPFSQSQSTHDKLMLIEGLMKSLGANGIKVQGVYFLVNHEVLQDEHLDFSNPWLA